MNFNVQQALAAKVIYAINAGGENHVDTYGIRYQHDPLRSVGTASDYGKQLMIGKLLLQNVWYLFTMKWHLNILRPIYSELEAVV